MPKTFQEGLRGELQVLRDLGRKGPTWEAQALSRCTLHEDLGYYSDSTNSDYGLDEATRDRLIAHARQDAAHAVAASKYILDRLSTLRLISLASLVLNVVLAAYMLWAV
jgi:hypothetical protein